MLEEPRKLIDSVNAFVDSLRAQAIHVGVGDVTAGKPVRCVVCEEPWPCTTAKEQGNAGD